VHTLQKNAALFQLKFGSNEQTCTLKNAGLF